MSRNPTDNCVDVDLVVNGEELRVRIEPTKTLLELLRELLGLTGTKCGCGIGECGACTVLLDDRPVNACLVLAGQVNGGRVRTVEGLAVDGQLHPVQEAFIAEHAVQCGYCTPGMIMSAVGLLEQESNPSDDQIKRALAGNLCRCTGYERILRAVRRAAGRQHAERQDG